MSQNGRQYTLLQIFRVGMSGRLYNETELKQLPSSPMAWRRS
jgi:hypothetical protein